MRKVVYIFMLVAVAALVQKAAGGQIPLRETEIPTPDYLYQVEAAYAQGCWVSDFKQADQQYLLTLQNNVKLVLHKLNDKGEVTGEPVSYEVQKPEQFRPERLFVRDVAFHPTLPLLYVWQDISGNQQNHSSKELIFSEFRHLLVFSVENGNFKLLTQAAVGRHYAFATSRSPIAVSSSGRRLYVSAVHKDSENYEDAFAECAGYIDLDDAGMPVMVEGKAQLVLKDAQIRSRDYRLGAYPDSYQWREGKYSLHPQQNDYIAFTTKHDLHLLYMGKDTPETPEEVRFDLLAYGGSHFCMCVPHPSYPVVYVRSMNQLYYIELIDYRPTLLPQYLSIDAQFNTPPVVIETAHRVVVGLNNGSVWLAEIDKYGRLTGNVEVVKQQLNNLAYSARFKKLYVTW